jgi:hypothetical protein
LGGVAGRPSERQPRWKTPEATRGAKDSRSIGNPSIGPLFKSTMKEMQKLAGKTYATFD